MTGISLGNVVLDCPEPRALAEFTVASSAAEDGRTWRVYADPAGHPFCLCTC